MSSSPTSSSSSDLVPVNSPAAPRTIDAPANGNGGDPFARLRDVVCPVEVVLGTGHMSLRRVLAIERGSVIRLSQSAGEDLFVVVNGVRLAEAEVIIIDETIAVRVTHLSGPSRERTV